MIDLNILILLLVFILLLLLFLHSQQNLMPHTNRIYRPKPMLTIKMVKSSSGELVDIMTKPSHSNACQTAAAAAPTATATVKRRLKRFICELCKSNTKTILWICASAWAFRSLRFISPREYVLFFHLIFHSLRFVLSQEAWCDVSFSWRRKRKRKNGMLPFIWTMCFIIFVTHGIRRAAEHPDKIYRLL